MDIPLLVFMLHLITRALAVYRWERLDCIAKVMPWLDIVSVMWFILRYYLYIRLYTWEDAR